MSATIEKESPAARPRRVSRASGTMYRGDDGKTEARLFAKPHAGNCDECGDPLAQGTDVLGVAKDQPQNTMGRWVFFCLDCAQKTAFEPVTGKPWAGKKKPKASAAEVEHEEAVRPSGIETAKILHEGETVYVFRRDGGGLVPAVVGEARPEGEEVEEVVLVGPISSRPLLPYRNDGTVSHQSRTLLGASTLREGDEVIVRRHDGTDVPGRVGHCNPVHDHVASIWTPVGVRPCAISLHSRKDLSELRAVSNPGVHAGPATVEVAIYTYATHIDRAGEGEAEVASDA